MKKARISGITVVIVLALCVVIATHPIGVFRFFHPPSRQEVIETVFKGHVIFDVMTNSPQATAQRLHEKSDGNSFLLSDYTRDAPLTLTADQAQQMKNLLQSPSSYLWDVTRTCMPHYGVIYNFQSGDHTVHAAFCFKCNIIGIFDGDNDASNAISSSFLFDPMRGQMVTLSKTLFPGDKDIQALK